MYRTEFAIQGVDIESLTKDQIRVAFILRLPFRLRVGRLFHFCADIDGPFEISCRNSLNLPPGTGSLEALRHVRRSYEVLWTDALIIMGRPRVEESDLQAIREAAESTEPAQTNLTRNAFKALGALNQFIIAYSTSAKQLWGGRPLKELTKIEFFERLQWEITILCPESHVITDTAKSELFDLRPEREITQLGGLTGELDDLSNEELSDIGGAIARQKEYVFYEFAFQAMSRMATDDVVGALLMAAIALEGVHAAYVRHMLSDQIDPYVLNNFFREQGFMTLCRLTPSLLMEENERPSRELLRACVKGIQMRNDIMHALTNRRGEYKIRGHKPIELSEAYKAVLRMYECYVRALEKRTPSAR